MKEDLWRFFCVIAFSLTAGIITGQVAVCMVTAMMLYLLWQYQTLKQLFYWLRRRKAFNPPEVPGIIDEIISEIDYMRLRHKRRKNKLSSFLRGFKDAISALPDATVILGEFGEIDWANSKAMDYLGICWPRDKRQRVANLVRHPDLNAYLNDKKRIDSGKALQLVSPANAGQRLEIRVVPYGVNQKLLVARDITRIHHIDQMRKDFIANASHELRTPLTVISGYLETFDNDTSDRPVNWVPQIRQMREQSRRMQRLIEDLLMLSTLESGTEQGTSGVVDVAAMLNAIYHDAQALSGEKGHIFYLETDPDLLICGNQHELRSAFANLVFNAIQYTPGKGIIRIKWYKGDNAVFLEVSDTGIGISPEHIPRLTERFYRVDKGRSRDEGGTGLGLAIVKHVLTRHGGRLQIESQLGRGSLFRCVLPLAAVVAKPEEGRESRSA